MTIKFQRLGTSSSVFKPGGLTQLADNVMSTEKLSEVKAPLTPDELSRIPQVYSMLEPDVDIPALENEKIYKGVDGLEIFGSDIKAITMLMYSKPRGAYCRFGKGGQVHAKTCNGATPLGLLAFKRYKNISYDAWRKAATEHLTWKKESTDDYSKYVLGIKEGKEEEAIRIAFKVDLLLGKTYASTELVEGTICWKKDLTDHYGLIALSTFSENMWKPTAKDIEFFRTEDGGTGKLRSSPATSVQTARIRTAIPEGVDKDRAKLYDNCDDFIRLMLAQRWAWYAYHRTNDMICDFTNWDNMPDGTDLPSRAFVGLTPKDGPTDGKPGIYGAFGL